MGGARRSLAWLAGLAAALLIVFVWPYAVDGHRFGVGPDVPVYLWWTRVGAFEGLSMVGSRPGAPALAAALAGTLQLNVAAVTAALASALGVALGVAAAAFVRSGGGRSAEAWLAGLLAGVFSVHLVAGYLANMVLAVCLLAAAACLAGGRRRWWAAALLLAGGGLAHPAFLVHAIVVLLGAAALAWRAGARDEARDVVLAAGAGGLVAGAGVLATIAGRGPIAAETSRDGLLRRAGLDAQVVDAYRERFRLRAARYVQWVSVPLAVLGVIDDGGFRRRFLVSWLVVMAVAVPFGWITGWFPPDRIVTFGFAVPIAAALGVGWVLRRHVRRPWITRVAVGALVGWMIVGALLAWLRQSTFISVKEAREVESAMRLVATEMRPRPIVFLVDDEDATATFLAARAANIVRGASLPARAGDVYVFVGRATDYFERRPTVRPNSEYRALSRLTLSAIPRSRRPLVFVVRQFYRGRDAATDPHLTPIGRNLFVSEADSFGVVRGIDEPERLSWGTASPAGIVGATVGIVVLLMVIGLGYASAAHDDPGLSLATAPAFGAASLTLAAVLLDRLGLRLVEIPVALAASALAGLGGLVLFLVQLQRNRQSTT